MVEGDWTVAHLRSVIDERDLRYQQRFDAQEKALNQATKEAANVVAQHRANLASVYALCAMAVSITSLILTVIIH